MEPQTNAPHLEKLSKMKVSYHNLLLWAINDVRVSLAKNYPDVGDKLNALIAILPPELRPLVNDHITRSTKSLVDFERSITHTEFCRYRYWSEENTLSKADFLKEFGNHLDHCKLKVLKTWWDPKHRLEATDHQRLTAGRVSYFSEALAFVIKTLDDHGLMREFRKEEVGGL